MYTLLVDNSSFTRHIKVDGSDAGSTVTLLNTYGASQEWTTETVTVPTSGMYKFVFIR